MQRVRPGHVRPGADRVRPFELFFDLVFVFSLIQITNSIVDDNDILGVVHGLVVLFIVWWIWASFTAVANVGLGASDRSDWRPVIFIAAMAVMLLVDISIPTAFWENDRLFAYGVGALFILWAVAYLRLTTGAPTLRRDVYRMIGLAALLPLTLIVSAYVASVAASIALLSIGLVAAAMTAIIPRSPDWPIGREHLAERYELFLIITLGETLISIGLGASNAERNAELIVGVLVSVVLVAVMWRTYLVGVADPGRRRLLSLDYHGSVRLTRTGYVFLHLVLVAGIIGVAAGLKVALKDVYTPVTELFGGTLVVGLAAFLLTVMLFRRILTARFEWWRLIPLAALFGVWFIAGDAPDIVFLVATTLVAIIGSLPDLRPRAPEPIPTNGDEEPAGPSASSPA